MFKLQSEYQPKGDQPVAIDQQLENGWYFFVDVEKGLDAAFEAVVERTHALPERAVRPLVEPRSAERVAAVTAEGRKPVLASGCGADGVVTARPVLLDAARGVPGPARTGTRVPDGAGWTAA